jgi:tripartite-type tricarboxylate transporter receptor subunit TctC
VTRFPLARRALAMLALTALAAPSLVQAQASAWPSRPVTIVVPFPPGGGTDAFARPLFAAMTRAMGRQFVIDNKGGAGGTWAPASRPRPRPTATPSSWARCTTRSRPACTPGSTTTSRPTSCPWA